MTKETDTNVATEPAISEVPGDAVKTFNRDEIRKAVFGAKVKTKTIEDFFGVVIEVRQPSMGVVLAKRHEDKDGQTLSMLIDYTYVDGTDEKVFTPEDADALMSLPFGKEMQNYMQVVNELLGVDTSKLQGALVDAEKST